MRGPTEFMLAIQHMQSIAIQELYYCRCNVNVTSARGDAAVERCRVDWLMLSGIYSRKIREKTFDLFVQQACTCSVRYGFICNQQQQSEATAIHSSIRLHQKQSSMIANKLCVSQRTCMWFTRMQELMRIRRSKISSQNKQLNSRHSSFALLDIC